jgi:SAM-dependent MidA family methyltransferase
MSIDLDPGRAALGNARLVNAIIEEMAGGPITFQRFMELALYHPEHGYYTRPGRVGPQGDFLTSPAIHPMFGWAVAGWCRRTWELLGEPAEFTLVEPGAGAGQLATTILDWASGRDDGFARALRYVAIEPYAHGSDPRVTWASCLPEPADAGAVLSNEFFDALPVRLFEATERGPVEVCVRWDGERFVEARGSLATIDGAPAEGRFEVSNLAYGTMRSLAGLIERGAVLTFDYGYRQEDLWAPWRRGGTLLCFFRHTAHENPLVHVGEQDITAHVNLTDLAAALEDEGFRTFGPASQASFLSGLGLAGLVEAARQDMAEYFVRRRAFQQLTDSGGLGRVRVLAGAKGLQGEPAGFGERP